MASGTFQHRALRLGIEAANRVDLVTEEFHAHRAIRFGGKHIQNAAAYGVLAHHLDGFAAFITDAFQVGRQHLERQFLAHAKR